MPANIKTILQLDNKPLKDKLKEAEKYYRETYKEFAISTDKVNETNKNLTRTLSIQATQKNKLLAIDKKLEAEKKKGKKADKEKIALLEKQAVQTQRNIDRTNKLEKSYRNLNKAQKLAASASRSEARNIKDATNELKSKEKQVNKATKSTQNLANATIRYLRWAGTIAGVVYAANRAWDATIGKGIQVNETIETNTKGIGALIAANTRMEDSLGNTLTPMEKFIKAQEYAKTTIDEIRTASIKTAATFPQLLEIFVQGEGKALSMGDSFGESIEDINKNLVKFSARMSNFANAIGMPMDRVKEEMRSMMSGNASTDSLISTIVFGSPSEANEAIGKASSQTNGMVKLLNKEFKGFDILGDEKTYRKSILAATDAYTRAVGDMVEKSGAFQDITNMFYDMSESIIANTDDIVDGFDSVYNGTKNFLTIAEKVATPMAAVAAGVVGVSVASGALALATRGLTAAMAINPLWLLITGVATVAYNFDDIADGIDNLVISAKKAAGIKLSDFDMKVIGGDYKEELKDIKTLNDYGNKAVELQLKKGEMNSQEWNERRKILTIYYEENKEKLKENSINKKNVDKIKERAKLLANLNRDDKLREEFLKRSDNAEEKILKLQNLRAKGLRDIAKTEKELAKTKKGTVSEEGLKEQLKIIKKGVLDVEKEITDEQLKKNNELAKELGIAEKLRLLKSGEYTDEKLSIALSEIKTKQYEKTLSQMDASKERDVIEVAYLMEKMRLEKLRTDEVTKRQKLEVKNTLADIDNESDAFNTMLDGQIALIDATNTWNNSLEGTAKTIGNVMGAISNMAKADLVSKKKQYATSEKLAKAEAKYGKDSIEFAEAENKYIMETSDNKIANQNAELAGYSALAGAMASAYEQGASGAILFTAAQSALGIASSWTAIAQAWALGFPANIAAVGMVTSAVMPIIDQLGGSSGGSGGSSVSSDVMQKSKFTAEMSEMTLQPLIDLGEEQVELLRIIGLEGTAGRYELDNSKKQYELDLSKKAEEIIQSTATQVLVSWSKDYDVEGINKAFENQFSKINKNVGDDVFQKEEKTKGTAILFNADAFRKNALATMGEIINLGLYNVMADYKDAQEAGAETQTEIEAWVMAKGKQDIYDLQSLTNDYVKSISDVVDGMSDAKDTMKEVYDELTQTTTYATRDFIKAFDEVAKLTGSKKQEDLEKYLSKQIGIIETVERGLTSSIKELFLSTDPKDIQLQVKELEKLRLATGEAFTKGSEDVLNYIDSIELVSETMVKSRDNITSFVNSFKTSESLLSDSAKGLGVSFATTAEEFGVLLDLLSLDEMGLTNEELDFLERNSEAIRSSAKNITSFVNSFKTSEMILSDSAKSFGVSVAKTKDELISLFNIFSDDPMGLTDEELKFLEQNKKSLDDIIESEEKLNDTRIKSIKDLFGIFDSMTTSTKKSIDTLRFSGQDSEQSKLIQFNELLNTFNANKDTMDFKTLKSTYSEILKLSTDVGKDSSYTQSMIGILEEQMSGFDVDTDIMKVTLVDGLGRAIGLSTDSKGQLLTALDDTVLTQQEIDKLNITDTQKDQVKTFSDKYGFTGDANSINAIMAMLSESTNMFAESEIQTDYLANIDQNTRMTYESILAQLSDIQKTVLQSKTADSVDIKTDKEEAQSSVKKAFSQVLGRNNIDINDSGFKYWVNSLMADNNITEDTLKEAIARGSDASDISSGLSYLSANNILHGESLIDRLYMEGTISDLDAMKYFDQYGMPDVNMDGFYKYFDTYDQFKSNAKEKGAYKQFYIGGNTGAGADTKVAGIVHANEHVINARQLRSVGGSEVVQSFVNGSINNIMSKMVSLQSNLGAKVDNLVNQMDAMVSLNFQQSYLMSAQLEQQESIQRNTQQ